MHFANGVRKDKEGEAEERRMSPSSLINRIVFIQQEAVSSVLQLLSSSNPKLNQDGSDAAFRPGGNNQRRDEVSFLGAASGRAGVKVQNNMKCVKSLGFL